ncbi:PAS domain-containing protein [Coleofasciculus sp. FACHB-1120]|uniref:PAS domain-containing sensor histidine kinase n=1 Tax=Coleofasciculus sp. FACHB-1120 TaxID=2692783 RepID=UPI001684EC30|nr:PAS domain-containing protein [Coleofasciculus sp. FACHB-1120]MBD2740196.1 PAS domain-containing protein [Coleofasciculus sp. FACHB-1120]
MKLLPGVGFQLMRYGIALLAVTLALLIQLILNILTGGKETPFLILFAGILVGSWYGGTKLGLWNAVLGAFGKAKKYQEAGSLSDSVWEMQLGSAVSNNPQRSLSTPDRSRDRAWKEMLSARSFLPPTPTVSADELPSRQQTQAALRTSEERLRLSLEAGRMGIWDWNILTGEMTWSDTLERMHGLVPETFAGTFAAFVELVHPDDRDSLTRAIAQSVEQKTDFELEFRVVWSDSSIHWISGKGQVLSDETGNAVRIIGVSTDISESVRHATLRQRIDEQQRFLGEATTLLTSSLDYQTTLETLAQLAVPQLADWCSIDMLDENQTIRRLAVVHQDPSKVDWAYQLQERYPPDPDAPYGLPNVLRTGEAELYAEVPDSLLVEVARDAEHLEILRNIGFTSAMVVPLVARGRTLGAITFTSAESGRHYGQADLTFACELARRAALAVDNAGLFKTLQQELAERQRTEAALRESEERFRTMADTAPVLLWVAGTGGQCDFFNQRWLTFRGRTLEEELDQGWSQGVHPEDLQRCSDTYQAAFQVHKNFQMEYRLLRADGQYRWVLDTGTPRFLADGSFAGYIGSCVDITERKIAEEALCDRAAELARLSTILTNTNAALEKRNAELDHFAYIVSHDLKAPLRAISNLSTWIEEDLLDLLNPETQRNMNLLRGRVHRMEALINGLLQYSRVGRIKTVVDLVDVDTLLAEVISSLAPPPTFTITIQPGMPTFLTERSSLEQVFANLLSNCFKHHPRSDGTATISVQDKEAFYEFAVADDGCGIDPQYHEKIFVMFQTLEARDKVENTGVGLAIVKKVIENKGGTIYLKSQLNQGSTFYFTWPK